MRGFILLVAGFLLPLTPSLCAGQDEAETVLPGPEVAALVRQALRSPDAPESWASLAQGLSGLKGPQGQGGTPVSVLAAVRIADSLAFSPLLTAVRGVENQRPGSGVSEGSWIPGSVSEALGMLGGLLPVGFAFVVFLGLAATGWIPGLRGVEGVMIRGGKGGIRRGRAGADSPPGQRKKADNRSMALSLAEHGMPASEVARRTGMAQDEVAVVLALHRRQQEARGRIPSLRRSA